jgi:hypothetical protein
MTDEFDFSRNRRPWNVLRFVLTNPLGWPILSEFAPWQIRWAKMAIRLYEKGYWVNVPARLWADFLRPADMEEVRIYPGVIKLMPVEVLVMKKRGKNAQME